jgi:hypothetical protein
MPAVVMTTTTPPPKMPNDVCICVNTHNHILTCCSVRMSVRQPEEASTVRLVLLLLSFFSLDRPRCRCASVISDFVIQCFRRSSASRSAFPVIASCTPRLTACRAWARCARGSRSPCSAACRPPPPRSPSPRSPGRCCGSVVPCVSRGGFQSSRDRAIKQILRSIDRSDHRRSVQASTGVSHFSCLRTRR